MLRHTLVAAVVVVTVGGGSGNLHAGMAPPAPAWTEQTRDAFAVGTFRDWNGHAASFFVDAKSGLLLGPIDHDARDVHKRLPPALTLGQRGTLTFVGPPRVAGMTPADGPLVEGTFRSFEPFRYPPVPVAALLEQCRSPFLLGLLGKSMHARIWGIPTEDGLRHALRGLLLAGANEEARALLREKLAGPPTNPTLDPRPTAALLLDKLPGLLAAPPCTGACHPLYRLVPAARDWLAGHRDEAKRKLRAIVRDQFYFDFHDEPMPSSEGPVVRVENGPFARGDFLQKYGRLVKRADAGFYAALLGEWHARNQP